MSVVRAVQGRTYTLTKTLYAGSTPTDPSPDVATVVATRESDGTTLSPAVDNTGTPGKVTITFTAVQLATLDTLHVVTTAESAGHVQTYQDKVEVVGGVIFTLPELRELEPFQNTTKYPDERLARTRTQVEQRIERVLKYAVVPRYAKRTLRTAGWPGVPLIVDPYLRTIRSVSHDGYDYTAEDLAALDVSGTGVFSGGRWGTNTDVTVGYEHGLDEMPEDGKMGAMLLARSWLVAGPVDDRAASYTSSESGATYSLVVPGRRGSWVGVPDVDAWIEQNRLVSIG
jgi:hypothetical protein